MISDSCQNLIDDFFKGLQLRKRDMCQDILQLLAHLAEQEAVCQNWHAYLTGIFKMEFQRDFAESERLLKALLEKDLDPTLYGRVHNSLGLGYDYQGRWHDALEIYEQCLTLFKQSNQRLAQAKIWKNMAITLQKGFTRGEFGHSDLHQAIQYCRLALDTLEDLKSLNQAELWLEATTWNELGTIYRSLSDWTQAIHCYEQCLALRHTMDDRYGIGMTRNNMGEVLQGQGFEKWPEALSAFQEAREIYREFNDTYEEVDALANLASLCHEMGDFAAAIAFYEQAIEIIESLRVGITDEIGRAGFFATVIDTYANAVLLYLKTGDDGKAFDTVERARSRAFLDLLAAGSAEFSQEEEATPITLAEVQSILKNDELILEYFTTGLLETRDVPTSNLKRHRFPPQHTLIFVVSRNGLQVHDAKLSPNDLRPSQLNSAVERHFLQPQIRCALYDRLISPVEEMFRDRERLYLIPHGPLHYIPFQALTAADGETLLRESGPQLIYSPSASFLCHARQKRDNYVPESCLTLGYNSEGPNQLDFAEEEALSIAQLTTGRVMIGSSPKKEALYDQAVNYRLLHLACHGEFKPESPLASFLKLAPDEKLTALDVLQQLNLQCDLVTLSACESGLSRVRRGDELIGFMRAFMSKGTTALVSTLWRVNDHPTRILMERFYQEIQAGVEFAEALKRAQLYIKNLSYQEAQNIIAPRVEDQIDKTDTLDAPLPGQDVVLHETDQQIFADPYYWAAFIYVGIRESQ